MMQCSVRVVIGLAAAVQLASFLVFSWTSSIWTGFFRLREENSRKMTVAALHRNKTFPVNRSWRKNTLLDKTISYPYILWFSVMTPCSLSRWVPVFERNVSINALKTKHTLFYLKTQSIPRSKHFSSRLQKPISLCCNWHKLLFLLR
jgi:hypothetical protein